MKKILLMAFMVVGAAWGALENNGGYVISEVTVTSGHPWVKWVNVEFTVTPPVGVTTSPNKLLKLEVCASNGLDRIYVSPNSIRGALFGTSGRQGFVWDPTVDHTGAVFSDLTFHLAVAATNVTPTYMTVRLNDGLVQYYDATFANKVTDNDYGCRQNRIAFRYIPPTTSDEWKALSDGNDFFVFGAPTNDCSKSYKLASDWVKEAPRRVKLTKGFFLGVFPLTWGQCEWLGFLRPATGAQTGHNVGEAASGLSYNKLRGTDGSGSSYNFPTSASVDPNSIVGVLREKTGLDFDLPTEAQWEYACRAGSTNAYWFTETDTVPDEAMLMNCIKTEWVGTKKPNRWGIYDMVGCIHQWTTTLGRLSSSTSLNEAGNNLVVFDEDSIDPLGPTPTYASPYRIVRGSHFKANGTQNMYDGVSRDIRFRVYRTAYRYPQNSASPGELGYCGARLCLTLAKEDPE